MTEKLKQGIDQLGLKVAETIQQSMLAFLAFLQKWNQAYNLTAITEIKSMITHHLLDSLSILPYLKGDKILDVGSGAGFPGIPLAFACPEKKFTLIDSKAKKTAFLLQAASRFKITNATIIQERVGSYQPGFYFDTITCRALGSVREIMEQTNHLLRSGGQWLIMKGAYPEKELRGTDASAIVHVLNVPGLKAERHLVEVKNNKG
ncbi:16S rRNA (guanine(527)-N(7))-methyltransferase RsmG [Coxiella burnetii]|uniref:16S rRNA (guanine(527)-N(7))-methyltransferase RsmG n=1 Tax=Coxiella burnetii TaxID=777 RepID=UPI00398CA819